MISKEWDILLKEEYEKDYYKNLFSFLENEYNNKTIYPSRDNLFTSLINTSYEKINVVILGQDPYHGDGEAHGLCFSVREGIKTPPSLKNIFKELYNDLEIKRINTDLTDWSKQGVLLLNSIMTVEKDNPLSHKNRGWEKFTDNIIELLGKREKPIVFILWGNYAKSKKELIKNKNHFILESVHPSPLSASRGFFGSKPFSKTNKFLKDNKFEKIIW